MHSPMMTKTQLHPLLLTVAVALALPACDKSDKSMEKSGEQEMKKETLKPEMADKKDMAEKEDMKEDMADEEEAMDKDEMKKDMGDEGKEEMKKDMEDEDKEMDKEDDEGGW